MTIVDGKLYWLSDAYDEVKSHPYSEPYSGQIGDDELYQKLNQSGLYAYVMGM